MFNIVDKSEHECGICKGFVRSSCAFFHLTVGEIFSGFAVITIPKKVNYVCAYHLQMRIINLPLESEQIIKK